MALTVTGCAPNFTPPTADYSVPAKLAPLTVTFTPGSGELPPASAAVLRRIAETLPVQTVPELYLSGPLTLSRARSVREALARPVVVYPAFALPGSLASNPDAALLLLRMPDAIEPDACRGVGEQGPAGIAPGDDGRRERMLPPGCATAASIAAQVDRPTDLVQGRPLPPGAASPFADAIERYYRRNQPGQETSPASSHTDAGSADAPAASGANPLAGPLPPTPAAP